MYGRKFGKSLCHAWGASPLYLLGKYYLGVKPSSAGYATYTAEPVLGGLQWMEGKVPAPGGEISLYCSRTQVKIKAAEGVGTLRLRSKARPTGKNLEYKTLPGNLYEISIKPGVEYVIGYQAL
jgi:hypothetical protein